MSKTSFETLESAGERLLVFYFIDYFKLTLKSVFFLLSHSHWLRERCDLEQKIACAIRE